MRTALNYFSCRSIINPYMIAVVIIFPIPINNITISKLIPLGKKYSIVLCIFHIGWRPRISFFSSSRSQPSIDTNSASILTIIITYICTSCFYNRLTINLCFKIIAKDIITCSAFILTKSSIKVLSHVKQPFFLFASINIFSIGTRYARIHIRAIFFNISFSSIYIAISITSVYQCLT